jgi:predicted nucleic acid-binding protein
MILVDTSVWIDHFRKGDALVREILEKRQVLVHPFIIGELALGNMRERNVILRALSDLPKAVHADESEVLDYIERRALRGSGIGYLDAHLLTSVQMTPDALLWTRDKRLADVAARLSLAFAAN